jgi:hypothetical protein
MTAARNVELGRFRRFAEGVGLDLEPFQLDVIEAVLSDRREVVISQPRGAGKTTLLGAYAIWELVRHPEATIICAAAARDPGAAFVPGGGALREACPGAPQAAHLHAAGDPHTGGRPLDRREAPTLRSRWATTRIW